MEFKLPKNPYLKYPLPGIQGSAGQYFAYQESQKATLKAVVEWLESHKRYQHVGDMSIYDIADSEISQLKEGLK
ncbi:MAG: hypothetical protein PHU23_06030 [Dehalococcoidales bacterium]|nr:hypothetical protein [Dehalococcoidales bacterium]